MNNDLNMTCTNIREELKQFLDDRLIEKDYRTFLFHLESCSKCKEYVRAIDALPNQLWKLGDVDVPSDLSSSIIFKLKKLEQDTPQSSLVLSKKMTFGIIILIIGFFMLFWGIKFFKTLKSSSKADNVEIVIMYNVKEQEPIRNDERGDTVQIIEEQEPVSSEEDEYLYGQLQAMAESLELIAKGKIDEKFSEKTIPKKNNSLLLDETPKPGKTLIPDPYSFHWHIPYSSETEIKQLVDTIRILEISLDYEDENFLIFKTTNEKLKLLSDGIKFTNKLRLDLPGFITEGSFPDGEIHVSISFTGRNSLVSGMSALPPDQKRDVLGSLGKRVSSDRNILDWHILFISPQRNILLNVIRRGGGRIIYTSKETVVFSVPGALIKKLAEEIQSTGGIFADFSEIKFNEDPLTGGIVNVLIDFSEK